MTFSSDFEVFWHQDTCKTGSPKTQISTYVHTYQIRPSDEVWISPTTTNQNVTVSTGYLTSERVECLGSP